eukprot:s2911_g6.t1
MADSHSLPVERLRLPSILLLCHTCSYPHCGFSQGRRNSPSAVSRGAGINRAMERFWEGTGLLHQMRGEWFDAVSCCVTFTRGSIATRYEDTMKFRHTIVRLMSLCHGSALEEIGGEDSDFCETIDAAGLSDLTQHHLTECAEVLHFNRVEVLLHMIQSLITHNLDNGVLKVQPPILSRVYQTLSRGFVNLLNAKKIADTRFPFPFSQLISGLLLVHVVMLPILLSAVIAEVWLATTLTFIPIFSMCCLNYIGVELENPFGRDDNDLPLKHFQAAALCKSFYVSLPNGPAAVLSDCYISYDAAPETWRLDDGSRPPPKKPWEEVSYDPDTRIFRGPKLAVFLEVAVETMENH